MARQESEAELEAAGAAPTAAVLLRGYPWYSPRRPSSDAGRHLGSESDRALSTEAEGRSLRFDSVASFKLREELHKVLRRDLFTSVAVYFRPIADARTY